MFGTAGSRAGGEEKPLPPQVTALWVPGKVNVIEVTDFACKHCRKMHTVVDKLVEEEGDRVHLVTLTAPMPVHPQARTAARAFVCARDQGKADEMAEALFAVNDLSPDGCEQLAGIIDLSLPEFRTCVANPATEEQIDRDIAWVKDASPQGLPVVWVQDRVFFGSQSVDQLRWAVRLAESRMKDRGQ